jgi:hypothetical protein
MILYEILTNASPKITVVWKQIYDTLLNKHITSEYEDRIIRSTPLTQFAGYIRQIILSNLHPHSPQSQTIINLCNQQQFLDHSKETITQYHQDTI